MSILVGGDALALLAAARRHHAAADEAAADARAVVAAGERAVATAVLAAPLCPGRAVALAESFAAAEARLLAGAARARATATAVHAAGVAIEAAGGAALVATSYVHAPPRTAPLPVDVRVVRTEVASVAGGAGALNGQLAITVTEVVDPDGRTTWLVSRRTGAGVGVGAGVEANGAGAAAEVGAIGHVASTWAVPSADDARALVGRILRDDGPASLPVPQSFSSGVTIGALAAGAGGVVTAGLSVAMETSPGVGRAVEVIGSFGSVTPPQPLRGLPAGAATSIRIEAPTDPARARIVLTATTEQAVGAAGVPVLGGTNRGLEQQTRTWTIELTDEEDVRAARTLAEVTPATVGPEDVEAVVDLARRAEDLPATEEVTRATGTSQHLGGRAAVGIGGSADVDLTVWEAR